METLFEMIDRNVDGEVSWEEFIIWIEKPPADMTKLYWRKLADYFQDEGDGKTLVHKMRQLFSSYDGSKLNLEQFVQEIGKITQIPKTTLESLYVPPANGLIFASPPFTQML